ncbi:hypothetical protein ACFWIO_30965 [Streptomyces diastatochromogenes]|uniref:hypothetical protein n=1 Tax=Streptomyces diastatochromogenes TaxID=42236 RepID=UPI003659F800
MMRAPGAMELDEREAVRNPGRSGAGRQQPAMLVGTSTTMEYLGAGPAARQRIFEVVFDGLRPR